MKRRRVSCIESRMSKSLSRSCRLYGEDDDILIVYKGYGFKSLILLLSGFIVFNLLGHFL